MIYVPPKIFWDCYRLGIEREQLRIARGAGAVVESDTELEAVNSWLAHRWRCYLRARNVESFADRTIYRRACLIAGSTPAPSARMLNAETISTLRRLLTRIPIREAMILRLHYGLDGEPMTLQQIGQRIGVTRERIRQIEARALSRLREQIEPDEVSFDGERNCSLWRSP